MNFKLKALVAAAVTTMTMSGAANAINLNEMFLVASDASGQKTFVAALGNLAGQVSTFNGTSNLTTNLSGTNWTNFLNGAVDVKYQVMGFYPAATIAGFNAADEFVVTSNTLPGAFSNSGLNTLFNNVRSDTSSIGQFMRITYHGDLTGSGSKYIVGGGADGIGAVNTNIFSGYGGLNTTADLGTNLNFWNITRPTSSSPVTQTVKTAFAGEGNPALDFWNLNAAGVLTYNTAATAPVPEADTWAMMLLGLGFMGFVARRRQA